MVVTMDDGRERSKCRLWIGRRGKEREGGRRREGRVAREVQA